ncbi:MAG: lytic transglycosylase domain-containing protein [Lachnospiraceae bacterium]|nr:lytic transglycosylase domain-containing protein [Lachnospiraceae bacterium]
MKITDLDQVKTYTYSATPKASDNSSNFDSVFDSVTTIYAVPESSISQGNDTGKTINCPADMESIFQEASRAYGISENLLKAVAKAESDFNPNCTSSAGAMGVMQLMPSTAKTLGVKDAYNAHENIMGGAKLLSQLLQKYNGNTSLTLAAYNAGSGNVEKYGGIPPFKETQNYVKKILGYLGQSADDAGTIYAVASKDATNADNFYTITAVPENSLV